MKKITLLLTIMLLMIVKVNSQLIIIDETLMTATLPVGWVNLDIDMTPPDEFFAGNNLFQPTEFTPVNFTSTGPALYSCSEFDSTSTPATADDWLITSQVNLLNNSLLEFDLQTNGTDPTSFEVLIATTLAGATPVPSDFTLLNNYVPSGSGVWTTNTESLSAYPNQGVYIAFRNTTVDPMQDNQIKLVGLRNVRVVEPVADDISIDDITFDERQNPIDAPFVTAIDYSAFCGNSANVTIQITNKGTNPITTFDATFDNISSVVTETFTIPSLANEQSTTVTFSTPANIDTFDAYFIDAWVTMANDTISSNDSTLNRGNATLMVSPNTDTISLANPFYTSFEQVDAVGLDNLDNAFWTFENPEGNAQTFNIVDINNTQFTSYASDGVYTLQLLGDATASNSDWAFSPCMYFESTKVYIIKFKSRVGSFTSGAPVPATIALSLLADDNAASSVETLGSVIVDDNNSISTEYSVSFMPATTGVYNVGLQQATTGQDWTVFIDEFIVEELPAPNPPTISYTWDPCAEEATLTFNVVSGNTYTIDWGDGSAIETVTASPAIHAYTPGSTYTASTTVTNLAGSNNTSTMVDAAVLSAPDADFSYAQSGTSDASVGFTASSPLACNTYNWAFGDGNIATGPSAANTYVAGGTYTVTLTVTNSSGNNSTSQEVIYVDATAINEINFANGISIFPNPVTETLNVSFELNNSQDIEINLVAIDGKLVRTSIESNTTSVNASFKVNTLASGMYILDITTTEGKYTRNIMVK